MQHADSAAPVRVDERRGEGGGPRMRPCHPGIASSTRTARGTFAGPRVEQCRGEGRLAGAARAVDEHERMPPRRRRAPDRADGRLERQRAPADHAHTGWNVPAQTDPATATAAMAAASRSSAASGAPTVEGRAHVRSRVGAEAAGLHRRRELGSPTDREHQQRERHRRRPAHGAVVADPTARGGRATWPASPRRTGRRAGWPRARRARTAPGGARPARARRRGRWGRRA